MKKIFILLMVMQSTFGYEKKKVCQEAHTPIVKTLHFENTEGTYCYRYCQENDGMLQRCELCVQLTDADRQALTETILKPYPPNTYVKDIFPKLSPGSVVVQILTDIDRKIIIEKNDPQGATVADVQMFAMPKEVPDVRQRFLR